MEKTSEETKGEVYSIHEAKKDIKMIKFWNKYLEDEIKKIKIWVVFQWIVFAVVVVAISIISIC